MFAEFAADAGGDAGQILEIADSKQAASGLGGEIVEKHGAFHLFGRASRIGFGVVEDTHGINLDIRFDEGIADLMKGVGAPVVAAIGKNDQGFARIVRAFHLLQTDMDGIEERRLAGRLDVGDALVEFVGIGGERDRNFHASAEFDQEEFVIGVGCAEEGSGGFAGLIHLVAHAAAGIEEEADGKGGIFRAEGSDGLLDIIFEDVKAVGCQAGNRVAPGVGDMGGDQHQGGIDAQERLGERRLLGARLRRQAWNNSHILGQRCSYPYAKPECSAAHHAEIVYQPPANRKRGQVSRTTGGRHGLTGTPGRAEHFLMAARARSGACYTQKSTMAKQKNTEPEKETKLPPPALGVWAPPVLLGWLVPGGGHLLLRRKGRGLLLLVSITLMFLFGVMMRGAFFQPQTGDLLTTLINTGGFVGDLCSGLLYLLSAAFGYNTPDMPGASHDYGTKFLVAAGLLNVLAMVDAYEIAAGRKN